MSFGNAVVLQAGQSYSLRLVVKGQAPAVVATIRSPSGVIFQQSFAPKSTWTTISVNFSSSITTLNATFSVVSGRQGGEWSLGSVSLVPSTAWHGMRKDVVDMLKETGFHGLFRYPGGCYAPFYRWKIGLLPADQRPPIETPPHYCAAVAGGVNAYTDGMMENGA